MRMVCGPLEMSCDGRLLLTCFGPRLDERVLVARVGRTRPKSRSSALTFWVNVENFECSMIVSLVFPLCGA